MFAFVSHHSPLAHSAELIPGEASVTTAIGAKAMAVLATSRQTIVHIAHP